MEPVVTVRESSAPPPEKRDLSLAETIDRIAEAIGRCLDLRSLSSEIVSDVKRLVGADAATVFLLDQDGSLRCDTVEGGAETEVFGIRLEPGEGIAGWCAEQRRPALIPDVEKDDRFTDRVDSRTGYRTKSLIAVPLIIAGELVGVLEVVNRMDGGVFDEIGLGMLQSLAPHVAVAMNNARLTEELRQRATDLEQELHTRVGQIIHAKKEWEATIDAFADPILLIAPDRTVRRANIATARRAGLPIVAIPGSRCHEVAFGRAEPCEGCPLPEALEGRPATAELLVDKEIHLASHFPVESEPSVQAVACSYRDITLNKEMEHRLLSAERMASVGRLAAGIAHEVNNPIAFIVSNLGALRSYLEEMGEMVCQAAAEQGRQSPAPRMSEQYELMAELIEDGRAIIHESEEGASRVAKIVKQLGSFAHERRSTEDVFPLADCVRRVLHGLRNDFPKALISVEDDSSGKVRGCPSSFDQAIAAMVRNAIQASPEHVRIAIRDEPGQVFLSVEDKGPGIDETIRALVFEPFFTTRRIGEGMGLGLSVVYTAMSRHRGSAEIEDVPGGGTRVLIRVPAVEE